jgi:transposase-like protein
MLIDLKNLTPEQARWLEEHERLHKEAFVLFNRRKQFNSEVVNLEIEKLITNEEDR